jgi:hypothetical protein
MFDYHCGAFGTAYLKEYRKFNVKSFVNNTPGQAGLCQNVFEFERE